MGALMKGNRITPYRRMYAAYNRAPKEES